ncbi:MAG TPA: hypothetical protein VEY88_24620 [Archangium sp.]|nr:hypothetical protein [Archangium sp.]
MGVIGTRLFGKVDAVPNLGHVATKFFHINLLPLIPIESYFVVAQVRKGWVGVVIPINWKSVAVAWSRTGLLALGIVTWLIGGGQGNALMSWAGLACVVISIASNFIGRLNKADAERARELTELAVAGLGEEDITRTRMEQGLPVSAEAMVRVARGKSGNK